MHTTAPHARFATAPQNEALKQRPRLAPAVVGFACPALTYAPARAMAERRRLPVAAVARLSDLGKAEPGVVLGSSRWLVPGRAGHFLLLFFGFHGGYAMQGYEARAPSSAGDGVGFLAYGHERCPHCVDKHSSRILGSSTISVVFG